MAIYNSATLWLAFQQQYNKVNNNGLFSQYICMNASTWIHNANKQKWHLFGKSWPNVHQYCIHFNAFEHFHAIRKLVECIRNSKRILKMACMSSNPAEDYTLFACSDVPYWTIQWMLFTMFYSIESQTIFLRSIKSHIYNENKSKVNG